MILERNCSLTQIKMNYMYTYNVCVNLLSIILGGMDIDSMEVHTHIDE